MVLYVWMVQQQSDMSQGQVCSCASTRSYWGVLHLISSSAAGQSVGCTFAVCSNLSQRYVCQAFMAWGLQPRRVLLYSLTAALCSQETTGGEWRNTGTERDTSGMLMTWLPVSSKCWGSSSLVSLTPGCSSLFRSAANYLNLFWNFRANGWKEETDFQQ